jgi:hypothetical protein
LVGKQGMGRVVPLKLKMIQKVFKQVVHGHACVVILSKVEANLHLKKPNAHQRGHVSTLHVHPVPFWL